MKENSMILGIDHGNANIKTSTGFECKSGFTILNDEAITQKGLLQYQSKFYSVGAERIPVKLDKTMDEDFFILTLAAIAESINSAEDYILAEGKDIILAVGLPIVNYGRMKERFKTYFIRNDIQYKYEGKEYLININDCFVFPQSYAAILTKFSEFKNLPLVNVCDIGGGTTDCYIMEYGLLNTSSSFSLPIGIISLFNNLKQQVVSMNYHLTEQQLKQIILGKKPIFNEQAIEEICKESTQLFTKKILSQISEHGLELRLNPTIFIGGGAVLLKRFIEESKVGYAEVIEDIFCNAKGFEMLAKQMRVKR